VVHGARPLTGRARLIPAGTTLLGQVVLCQVARPRWGRRQRVDKEQPQEWRSGWAWM